MKTYIRNRGIVSADMDGELVMMSVDKGKYYGLGGIGPRIWDILEEPRTVADVVGVITAEYEVDPVECQRDVENYLQALLADNLISEA